MTINTSVQRKYPSARFGMRPDDRGREGENLAANEVLSEINNAVSTVMKDISREVFLFTGPSRSVGVAAGRHRGRGLWMTRPPVSRTTLNS